MTQPEIDPTFTQQERMEASEQTRMGRRRLIAEQAFAGFTLLPEVETGYAWEREFLKSKIVGQDEAIEAILSALDRADMRDPDEHTPIASFAFLGPTGVGKTETAKALSQIFSDQDTNLLRIDCSNFSHGHEVASLIGSPPGFVGREQTPILSQERLKKYGTVLLLDEVEKGSMQLTNLFLQIMENGKIELNNGKIVSFKNVIVVMTSNLGAKEMAREAGKGRAGFGIASGEQASRDVLTSTARKAFNDFFSPEFVNRLDDAIVFHPLDEPSLHQVLDVKLEQMNTTYVDEHGALVRLSDRTKDYLVQKALDERAMGVRPLVRALKKDVATNFGRHIAADNIKEGSEVFVYHREELESETSKQYTSELIFAVRPDASIKKKEIDDEVDLEAVVDLSTSTDLAVVDKDPENEE